MVISGNDRGKQGRVLDIDIEKKRAIVEGVNMVKKHTRPNADNPKGGIIESEAGVHISNLKVIDGKGNATRVGRQKDEKTGKIIRYSKKSGEVIK